MPSLTRRNICTLASFGTPSATKKLRDGAVTLQGNNGGWVTIPADQYLVNGTTGTLVQRDVDDSGAYVDWSTYASFRATYTVLDTGTPTTYTAEAQTFGLETNSFGDPLFASPVGTEGQIDLDSTSSPNIDSLIGGSPVSSTAGYAAQPERMYHRDTTQVDAHLAGPTTIYSVVVRATDLGAVGGLHVFLFGQFTNTTGSIRNPTVTVNFGAFSQSYPVSGFPSGASAGDWSIEVILFNTDSGHQKWWCKAFFFQEAAGKLDLKSCNFKNAVVDTTADATLSVEIGWNGTTTACTKEVGFTKLMP